MTGPGTVCCSRHHGPCSQLSTLPWLSHPVASSWLRAVPFSWVAFLSLGFSVCETQISALAHQGFCRSDKQRTGGKGLLVLLGVSPSTPWHHPDGTPLPKASSPPPPGKLSAQAPAPACALCPLPVSCCTDGPWFTVTRNFLLCCLFLLGSSRVHTCNILLRRPIFLLCAQPGVV